MRKTEDAEPSANREPLSTRRFSVRMRLGRRFSATSDFSLSFGLTTQWYLLAQTGHIAGSGSCEAWATSPIAFPPADESWGKLSLSPQWHAILVNTNPAIAGKSRRALMARYELAAEWTYYDSE